MTLTDERNESVDVRIACVGPKAGVTGTTIAASREYDAAGMVQFTAAVMAPAATGHGLKNPTSEA
jgi:hypothetical protein